MSRNRNYRFQTGSKVKTNTGEIKIVNQIRINSRKAYTYECCIDGYIGNITESNLIRNQGCSKCSKKSAGLTYSRSKGNIYKEKPEDVLCKYIKNEDLLKTKNFTMKDKVLMICPSCKREQYNIIGNVYYNKFCCEFCSDGKSYPEKLFSNILTQLSIAFETQKLFEWSRNVKSSNTKLCGNKYYDFYIPEIKTIIELHGMQHYEEVSFSRKSLEEEKENDILKKEIAINEVEKYVIIDCRYSNLDYIKKSIENSILNKLLDLSIIDWEYCERNALSSLVKSSCDLWNSGIHSCVEIGKILNIGKTTVRNYLLKGTKLGLCEYSRLKSDIYKNKKKKFNLKDYRNGLPLTHNGEGEEIV